MKTYQSLKIVNAVKCDLLKRGPDEEDTITLRANDGELYRVRNDFFSHGTPPGPFYIVEHKNGYRSWRLAKEFEDGYMEVAPAQDGIAPAG